MKNMILKSMILKKWRWPSVKKLRLSRKKALWGFVAIAIFILVIFLGVFPLLEATRKAEEEVALKRKVLLKYEEYLHNRKSIEEELALTAKEYEGIQQRLLSGETPQLGAANMQEIVKKLSEKSGIGIRSFKMLEPKEMSPYRKVSIQIEFNATNSMLSFAQFVSDLEHHEKELMISEMDLLVLNIRMPNNVQGSLVISGLMKGAKTKEKGRQG